MQRTFALVKPDAFAAGHAGKIMAKILESGLTVVAAKTLHLSERQARGFYHVHAERPFFGALVSFMTEGPILAMVLEGENAITRWRDLMGPTDATKAPKDTIRGMFGTDIERNATHGSDAPETAAFEVGYFFSGLELPSGS
jgi:nucleoside-diphosphate kinase